MIMILYHKHHMIKILVRSSTIVKYWIISLSTVRLQMVFSDFTEYIWYCDAIKDIFKFLNISVKGIRYSRDCQLIFSWKFVIWSISTCSFQICKKKIPSWLSFRDIYDRISTIFRQIFKIRIFIAVKKISQFQNSKR